MASKTILLLALFASSVSLILSIPQQHPIHILPVPQQPDASVDQVDQIQEPVAAPNELDLSHLPQISPRTFGSLFNLSAYLAGAPNNSAALNFIPLITILSAKGR